MTANKSTDLARAFSDAALGEQPAGARGLAKAGGALQSAAREHLAGLRLPTAKDEEWRFLRLGALTGAQFGPAASVSANITAEMVEDYALKEAAGSRFVFINGAFSPELSDTSALEGQKGVHFGTFGQDAELSGEVLEHLGQVSDYYADDYFATLNTAGFVDGAYLLVEKDTAVEGVVQLLYLSSESSEAFVSHPRNLIVMGRGSKATVVEDYVAPHSSAYLNNVLSEVRLADSANLAHTRVQRDSRAAVHVARTLIDLAKSSNYNSQNISLGARFSRYDVYANGDAEGINCTLDGLAFVDAEQISDTHTVMDHRKPNGESHQLHKMVVDGGAHTVFNGKIFVQPDAQIIDAYQLNRTLLLSPKARVNAKPQLEIFADDVKCTHGATIGQLEEDQLFYLRSRGLDAEQARNMLVYAFAAEVIEFIPVDSLKDALEAQVSRRTSRY